MSTGDGRLRLLGEEDMPQAMELVWQVFLAFEAGDYPAEGVEEFRRYIGADSMAEQRAKGMRLWGYEDGDDRIVGVLALRPPSHISLLFVDSRYHRRGIARRLWEKAKEECGLEEATVNSSPYAVEVYRRLGFVETGPEQVSNGMRFTPMHGRFGEGK